MTEIIKSSAINYRFYYGALILALILAGTFSAQHISVGQLATAAYENLALVSSMNAAVPPNEYNSLAQQFAQKEDELTSREEALLLRERTLDEKYQTEIAANKRVTFYTIGGAIIFLVLLIVANFYFDIKREEEHERQLRVSQDRGSQ